MKRAFDILIGGMILVLLAPVLLVTSILIVVTIGRPIIFRQWRAGMDGKPFQMYKFRTMRDGAGSDAERMTTFGRLLRSWSLDELPEFINVVKGDMSLVGPRPLHLYYLGRYTTRQARRHEVRPGITGLAQVSGRNALSWADRFELDVRYVERCSLRFDLKILLETLRAVARRDGISEQDGVTMREFAGRLGLADVARRSSDLPRRTADLPRRTADLPRRTADVPAGAGAGDLARRTSELPAVS